VSVAAALSLAGSALSAPIKADNVTYTDADILNFALTLEHLEAAFYAQGLANFSQANFPEYDESFYSNLQEIAFDETTHVDFLTAALGVAGAPAVAACTYSFPVTTPAEFIQLASVLEGVGITAYLGAAALISSDAYLTVAASILTVESRHNAYLRYALGESPFPQAFDAPLDYNEVHTLASQFIVTCPDTNPPFLPVSAFPTLSVDGPNPIETGSQITLAFSASAPSQRSHNKRATNGCCDSVFAAWATATGPIFVPAQCVGYNTYVSTVPAGIHGQSYVTLTESGTDGSDDFILAGPAIVEVAGTQGNPGV